MSGGGLPLDRGVITRREVRAPQTSVNRPIEVCSKVRCDGVDSPNSVTHARTDGLASPLGRIVGVGANAASEAGGSANLDEQVFSFPVQLFDSPDVGVGLGLVSLDAELIESAPVGTECIEVRQVITTRTDHGGGSRQLERRDLFTPMTDERHDVGEPLHVGEAAALITPGNLPDVSIANEHSRTGARRGDGSVNTRLER